MKILFHTQLPLSIIFHPHQFRKNYGYFIRSSPNFINNISVKRIAIYTYDSTVATTVSTVPFHT